MPSKESGDRPRPSIARLRLLLLEGAAACAQPPGAAREFHVSSACRRRFGLDQSLFAISGNVIMADFHSVRILAQKLNEEREAAGSRGMPVKAGTLNAMGLIDEILHYVVSLYSSQVHPGVFRDLAAELERTVGAERTREALLRFCADFPPLAVHRREASVEEYLQGASRGAANRETALEEMLLLWLANANTAFAPFRELFDDGGLARETPYLQLLESARRFFSRMPPFGPEAQSLVDMLRSPALAFPDSLPGQLRYIREKWGLLLGRYLDRLLSGLDLIKEDEKTFFPGPGPAAVFEAGMADGAGPGADEEGERFSADREWMPRLVLMAKTVHVWLDQLSRKYGRPVRTLDGVPDEELDRLAARGFTGLWLIGVWERSPASRRIKQRCGNPEAMASAYSLYRYEIAAELGGEPALENLKARAWARGIRLASDMVPNHMGIDSPWVMEHPEWFVSLDHSPFPAYRFTGDDLSGDPRVGIFLEDHYYDRSDAAVVFKWVDRRSGSVRYIYHGNDGTRMPWNDTAQLNYLRADVREAVVQTILEVARKFPIIRFDAAMTLTRRHYQRLWFPPPGSGGDIPSRAGQGLPREHFNRLMPWEFWREVVDRMAEVNPGTLLLAEAFWLMESYFVRTLGMHRVYNSAFMNFLKMEENGQFRLSLKNVLEFNPEILKRFVNFMNNPDEETAAAQFGGGDKYFAACTLLAALPGLPMFGHGQIEGFKEKYGMEYGKAYLDEREDAELLRRHERQIFPLLRRRALLAGVEDFLLYDFFLHGGKVDENVIAFSNCHGQERALVVVHNRYAETAGWIRVSVAFAAEGPFGGPRTLARKDLGWGLGLRDEPGWFVAFRDLVSGLEYIRSCRDLHSMGMFFSLSAYQTHVFLDFRELADDAGNSLARLAAYLDGRGCASLEDAAREMALQPLHAALGALCLPELLESLAAAFRGPLGGREENALWQELEQKLGVLAAHASGLANADCGRETIGAEILDDLLFLRRLAAAEPLPQGEAPGAEAGDYLRERFARLPEYVRSLFLWILLRRIARGKDGRCNFGEWRLERAVAGILRAWGTGEAQIAPNVKLLGILCAYADGISSFAARLVAAGKGVAAGCALLVEEVLENEEVRTLLQVHRFQEEEYFNREAFDLLCERLACQIVWELARAGESPSRRPGAAALAGEIMDFMNFLPALAGRARYQLSPFLGLLASLAVH